MNKTLPMNNDKRVPVGVALIGRTTYRVYDLGVSENSRNAGIRANLGLEGPRGATYLVTDHGPRYMLNSVACGGGSPWLCSPRPLRGLLREHLAAFLPVEGA